MTVSRLLTSLASVALVLGLASQAKADLITVSFSGNDCSGFFGSGFSNCDVGGGLTEPEPISPIIVKYNDNGSVDEINTLYSGIFSGPEITFGGGTWNYTPEIGVDPQVKYWSSKNANGFDLFWVVDDAPAVCSGGAYNRDCLLLALPQTTGTYTVPILRQGFLGHLIAREFSQEECPDEEAR